MAHVQKHAKGAIGNLTKHYERALNEKGEYVKFSNQEIDPEKTPDNYNIAPYRKMSQGEFIKQRCSEVKCLNRKDVKVMCSWVVTKPENIKPEEQAKFFEESYEFLKNRYGGEKNVISAYVHVDEVTPHIHFAFVPIIQDQNNGIEKVASSEAVNMTDLKTFHKDLENHMQQSFGREIGILNKATKDGNKSIAELKRNDIVEELEKIKQEIQNKQKQLDKMNRHIETLKKQSNSLQGKINGYEGAFNSMHDIPQGKQSIMGDKITFSKQEANDLKKTAEAYWSEKSKAISYLQDLQKMNLEIKELKDSPMMKKGTELIEKNLELESKNERLKSMFKSSEKNLENIKKAIDISLPEQSIMLIQKALKSLTSKIEKSTGQER